MDNNFQAQPLDDNNRPSNIGSTSNKSQFLIAGILCIFMPFLGAIGVHDFIVGRRKQGIAHAIMGVIGFLLFPLIMSGMACDSGCSGQQYHTAMSFMNTGFAALFIIGASAVWAFVECILFLIPSTRDRIINQSRHRQTTENRKPPQEMKSGERNPVPQVNILDLPRKYLIISIIIAVIVLLSIIIPIVSGTADQGGGGDLVAFFVLAPYLFIALPVCSILHITLLSRLSKSGHTAKNAYWTLAGSFIILILPIFIFLLTIFIKSA